MKAATYALRLASGWGSWLTAICVVQIPEYVEESTRAILRDELSAKSSKTLAEIGKLASEAKVKFDSEILQTSGSIATAVCNFAEKHGADLLVLGTRSDASGLTKMMLGSVASGVVSNANCPVLVVR